MDYNLIPTERFKKETKKLIKKFPSLKYELMKLNEILKKSPRSGTPLGNDAYKIRLSIKSKGKGKSGGARVITYVITEDLELYLITIFDKSEFNTIDDATLKKIIESIKNGK
jgi:mRNA-degrading endonuclease RelE of RelBE toxin-antitoxin system